MDDKRQGLRPGDALLLCAKSRGGAEKNPAWFFNLIANPVTTVEIGRSWFEVRAREATEEERASYWPQLVELYPSYNLYQQRTSRVLPVVVLEPLDAS